MMKRRFRRNRAKWQWADRIQLSVSSVSHQVAGTNHWIDFDWILPPGRTKWLTTTTGRKDRLTFMGAHLWLDFHWDVGTATGPALKDTYFYIIKAGEDIEGNIDEFNDPFVEPNPPSSTTSWFTSPSDGLDGFMWTHYIKGLTAPNSLVNTAAPSSTGGNVWNQSDVLSSGVTEGQHVFACRTESVRAEWQPDVKIKTRRRLEPDEGIAIAMFTDGQLVPGMSAILDVRHRVLCR